MKSLLVKPVTSIKGKINPLGDKSIAHRSIIISAITPGKTTIKNFPVNRDCFFTVKAFKKLGIKIVSEFADKSKLVSTVTVFGKGLYGLKMPKGHIFVGDSGTTFRLLLGVLAGQNFKVILKAGKSLSHRPMLRVTTPLRMMGVKIKSNIEYQKSILRLRSGLMASPSTRCTRLRAMLSLSKQSKVEPSRIEEYPPLEIKGGELKPITYRMPIASAQVKSAVLLAGLYAQGQTVVVEPIKTRDHTERLLNLFRADIKVRQNSIIIKGNKELISPGRVYIPADISSASFFVVASIILPNSQIYIKNVSLNPSRIGIIKVLNRMGADIRLSVVSCQLSAGEPMGDIIVKSSDLKGTTIRKKEIPALIDELPILMVAACFAEGTTIFEDVGELRVKETDRIRSMRFNLNKMGAQIQVVKAGSSEKIVIEEAKELRGAHLRSFGDHRTAMSIIVAALKAKGNSYIDDITCINKSFPNFLYILKTLMQ